MGNAGKLTLSVDKQIIEKAKRLARKRHTSVSAIFVRFIAETKEETAEEEIELGPITRQAMGLFKLPEGKTDRELLEEALWEKYMAE